MRKLLLIVKPDSLYQYKNLVAQGCCTKSLTARGVHFPSTTIQLFVFFAAPAYRQGNHPSWGLCPTDGAALHLIRHVYYAWSGLRKIALFSPLEFSFQITVLNFFFWYFTLYRAVYCIDQWGAFKNQIIKKKKFIALEFLVFPI